MPRLLELLYELLEFRLLRVWSVPGMAISRFIGLTGLAA